MVALPYSRTLAKQLLARSTRSFTRPASAPLLRVNCTCRANSEQANGRNGYRRLGLVLGQARSYATEATKPASRPKAHTGRASAKRNVSTKKAKSGTKATKKPKKKAIKKTKPKVKKAPSKTSLLKKERQRQSDLRATALLAPPKQLPQTAFTLVLVEEAKKGGGVKDRAVAASSKYRGLSSEEREQYNHEANANKEKNTVAYKQWVQSYTPLQIKEANNARRQLARKAKAAGKKTKFSPIKDDRHVKAPRNAYAFFFGERHASGDLRGMSVGESGKLLGREWKSLSASEQKPYIDQAGADKNRYVEEYKSVYGLDVPVRARKSS